MSTADSQSDRKGYAAPRIVHTEKLEARAVVCSKETEGTCGGGPIQS